MKSPARPSPMVWRLRVALGLLVVVAAAQAPSLSTLAPANGVAHAATEARAPAGTAARALAFTSADAAYEQGLGAVQAGKPEIAIAAFEFAGQQNHVPSLYYLGMLYANNDERVTDHAKAFHIFHRIVEQHAYVDPVADYRSVYVARAAVKLADYHRKGVPALGLKADAREAVELLNHAATYFGDLEAQFQLAKMHLTGDGVQGNERYGLHWLSSLARKNHAGAQAFLAELLWRGKFVHKDANQALAWSTLSIEGAREQDRLWIEEIYQTIYCGAAPGIRDTAGQLVADWHRRAPAAVGSTGSTDAVDRPLATGRAASRERPESAGLAAGGVRTCANGEPVPTIAPSGRSEPNPIRRGQTDQAPIPAPMPGAPPTGTEQSGRAASPRSGIAEVVGKELPPGDRTAAPPAPIFGQGFREFDKSDSGTARAR